MGIYPALPWIPYPAIRALVERRQPNWVVFEHGGGMSTIWWAQRVRHVTTIEASPEWHAKVLKELEARSIENVTLELRNGDSYTDLTAFADESFDCVVIDGHARDLVARDAFRIVRRPGVLYLDNTDFAAQWAESYGTAEDTLVDLAQSAGATVTHLTGFPPATFQTTQGLLIDLV